MSGNREYRKANRTPAQQAKVRAARAHFQAAKPSLAEVVAEAGEPAVPLGEFLLVRRLVAGLREERERQGVTVAALAARAGIDKAALSRLETGKTRNPTVATVVRVAGALGKAVSFHLRDAAPA